MSGSEGRSHTSPCDSTRASDCCPFRCYGARTGTIDNAGIVYVPVDHKQSFVRSLSLRCRPRFLGYDDELRRDILDQIYNCGVVEERFLRMEVRWMTLLRNRTSRGAKCVSDSRLAIKPLSNGPIKVYTLSQEGTAQILTPPSEAYLSQVGRRANPTRKHIVLILYLPPPGVFDLEVAFWLVNPRGWGARERRA